MANLSRFNPQDLRLQVGATPRAGRELYDHRFSRHDRGNIRTRQLLCGADKLVAPGGVMLHGIDLRGCGIFSDGGLQLLKFMTIPEMIIAIPRRLFRQFKELPDEELMVSGVFLIVRKPIATGLPAA